VVGEVDVLPLQPDELAATHPGEGGELVCDAVLLVFGVGCESAISSGE